MTFSVITLRRQSALAIKRQNTLTSNYILINRREGVVKGQIINGK